MAIPSSTMLRQTASSSSLSLDSASEDPSSRVKASEDREKFSAQTLILTALTAINNPNSHPTFNDILVNRERVQYMKDKVNRTAVIDAATTILVTNTEILATMTRGAQNAHSISDSILAVKDTTVQLEDSNHDEKLHALLQSKLNDISAGSELDIDALLPDSEYFCTEELESGHMPDVEDVFISFPNPNTAIPIPSSTYNSDDSFCKPIAVDNGRWASIMEKKCGYTGTSK
jgi:hypothetical protein